MTKKKPEVNLEGMLSPEPPTDTGYPQRGAEPPAKMPDEGAMPPVSSYPYRRRRRKVERRTDQLNVRTRPSIRERVEYMAEVLEEPIADVMERAILSEYARFLRKHPPEREED